MRGAGVDHEEGLRRIVRAQAWFVDILRTVRACDPPDWFVGGGVVRNLVWDHVHGYLEMTPVRDVDVAFFDPEDLSAEREQALERELRCRLPDVPWEVKNQAAVHLWYETKFGYAVSPLTSCIDAIGTWPETATSVGVRLLPDGDLHIVAPCGLDDLFAMRLRRNPRRVTEEQFRNRLNDKRIVERWPRVQVVF